MHRILWSIFIFSVSTAASECLPGVSMVQRQALPVVPPGKQRPRPWEVNNYIMANYHKAGVFLSEHLMKEIFYGLGAPEEAVGHVEYPCYGLIDSPMSVCLNVEAPVVMWCDGFNASIHSAVRRLKGGSKKLLVAGFVRDPLEMVASAYCYHHDGQEYGNLLFPVQDLMKMGVEEGTQVVAKSLLPLADWMTSAFEQPEQDTLRLELDDFTKSSEGFDLGVQRLLDHFFGTGTELISMQQRSFLAEAVKQFDEHRNPNATNVIKQGPIGGGEVVDHSSGEVCKEVAHSSLHKSLDPALLARYKALKRHSVEQGCMKFEQTSKELQRRLGYPVLTAL